MAESIRKRKGNGNGSSREGQPKVFEVKLGNSPTGLLSPVENGENGRMEEGNKASSARPAAICALLFLSCSNRQ
jgi:hypothetical protein